MTRTVAIVGGGVAGLTAAEALSLQTDARVIVLEAEEVAGGKVRSIRENGFVTEMGPHGFLDREPDMMALIKRLGLESSLVEADPRAAHRFILSGGRLMKVPESPPAFLRSNILPWRSRVRVLMEPWAKARPKAEESVYDFAVRRIGQCAAEALVDPMVTGIHAADPKKLSMRAAFPRVFALETEYGSLIRAQMKKRGQKKLGRLMSFKRGLGTLTESLAAQCEVRTSFVAKKIELQDGFCVYAQNGDSVKADAVVLALPAYASGPLVAPHSEAGASALANIPYAPVSVVVQGYGGSDMKRSLGGFGFLVSGQEKRTILGSIWGSSAFPPHVPEGMVMCRTLLGGSRTPACAEGTDETLSKRVRVELESILDMSAQVEPVYERVVRWPLGIPQYTLGHKERVRAVEAMEKALPRLFFTGNAFRGVGLVDCVLDAQRVARRVAEKLSEMEAGYRASQ